MKISDFKSPASFTALHTLRGVEITLRALSAAESQRLERLEVRPQPPLIVKPGSHPEHGPAVPYEFHPQYRQDLAAWFRRQRAREVAAAGGLTGDKGSEYARTMNDAELKGWSEDVVPAMLAQFTDEELASAHEALRRVCDPLSSDRIEAAAKN